MQLPSCLGGEGRVAACPDNAHKHTMFAPRILLLNKHQIYHGDNSSGLNDYPIA